MARLFWAWAALVWCICGKPLPLLAAPPLVVDTPPEQCSWSEAESYVGLRRQDTFERGQVVLTFDDGPQPVPTKQLLDLLDQHGYRATFFVVGLWVRADTYELIQRMAKSGHEIGTHTYSHDEYLTRRGWGVDYIEGQYELTHVLVELALLASSADDFKALYRRVFERKPGIPLKPSQVRALWHGIERNHLQLLEERGFDAEHRLYPMLFARPPGGIPYEGHWPKSMRSEHETALRHLGLLNVLWHGGSGDTVLGRLDDVQFLLDNVRYHTKKGGILLIHDRMRSDAMKAAFERLAKDRKINVTSLRAAAAAKYSCSAGTLYTSLRSSSALASREHAGSRRE
ncbi:MAG TPA: polysaccharide deacetylase family protein [Polyangiaceae bacterium]|nr:polysaccharide deacetylase family protein [Polyangiaceae bacterium]